jgi:hypothetical protein
MGTERLMETIDTLRKGLSTDPDAVLSNNSESNTFFALKYDANVKCS